MREYDFNSVGEMCKYWGFSEDAYFQYCKNSENNLDFEYNKDELPKSYSKVFEN